MVLCRPRIRDWSDCASSSARRFTACCRSADMLFRSQPPNWPRLPSRTLLRWPSPPQQEVEAMKSASGPVPGPGILDISPYIGGEANAPGIDRPIRLASNESALGPSPKAIAAYRELAAEIHRYPDGGALELREALGRHHGLDPERIVCGSGSDELIGMLLRAYAGPDSEVLYSRHGFLMYPIGAKAVGAKPISVPERA